jgi:hypothetical protein
LGNSSFYPAYAINCFASGVNVAIIAFPPII